MLGRELLYGIHDRYRKTSQCPQPPQGVRLYLVKKAGNAHIFGNVQEQIRRDETGTGNKKDEKGGEGETLGEGAQDNCPPSLIIKNKRIETISYSLI